MSADLTRPAVDTPDHAPRVRLVVVAPTFNHAAALGGVLRALHGLGLPVIVVNDGATDRTAEMLAAWVTAAEPGMPRSVLTHAVNKGKAAALRTGFEEATRLEFTHALTIDTDGQHDVRDVPSLLRLSAERADALVIGAREREGSRAPLGSRVGRAISNALVWLESGVRVTDSQTGMRVYPLASMARLSGRASRYGFETEVLVRAGWCGVPVVETPIRCIYQVPGGRTTHFRAWGDTWGAVRMHTGLLARALMPGPRVKPADGEAGTAPVDTGSIPRRLARWLSPRRLGRMAHGDAASRERLAASVGVGLLMATLPVYGIKTAGCLWLSGRFRLHPLAVVGVSSLSTPPVGLVFVGLSICVGGLLLHGRMPDVTAIDLTHAAQWSSVNALLTEWLLGSVVAGVGLGLLGYGVMLALLMRTAGPESALRQHRQGEGR
ncbi:MAG: glycosyltransferase family 2 protein [Phycisphaerales bacterium]|jgi:uncharacterized protein (DUF2062 family)